jgi:hypothetical protein
MMSSGLTTYLDLGAGNLIKSFLATSSYQIRNLSRIVPSLLPPGTPPSITIQVIIMLLMMMIAIIVIPRES